MDGVKAMRAANLIERIGRLVRAGEQTGGLNPVQWDTLRYLAQANRSSRTPAALAEYLASTRGTVSQTLIALENKGYVARVPSTRDRRSIELDLTEKGRLTLQSDPILAFAAEIEAAVAEGTEFDEALAALLKGMIARNGSKTFGQCASCRHFRRDEAQADPAGPHRCGLVDVPLSEHDSGRVCADHSP